MKIVTKEYNALSVEDIEAVVSESIGKQVSISDISCVLTYYVSIYTEMPECMGISFYANDEEVDAYDLFYNEEDSVYEYKGKKLSMNERFLEPDCIFDFDTKLFRSFETEADTGD